MASHGPTEYRKLMEEMEKIDKERGAPAEGMCEESDEEMCEDTSDESDYDGEVLDEESFDKLEHSLAHKKGVKDPKALAAYIGRKNGKIK